jgi:hypothetical protein
MTMRHIAQSRKQGAHPSPHSGEGSFVRFRFISPPPTDVLHMFSWRAIPYNARGR